MLLYQYLKIYYLICIIFLVHNFILFFFEKHVGNVWIFFILKKIILQSEPMMYSMC